MVLFSHKREGNELDTEQQSSEAFSPTEGSSEELAKDLQASREQFAGRLEPSPESVQFKAEIESPEMVEDSETGISYAVYRLNRDKAGTPLVLNLAWSVGAESGVGRADLNEFANHLDRPIVTIDMEATGKTGIPDRAERKAADFDSLAASHLRVIDKLGVNEFDIAGYSLGGVMAAGIAAQAGERVGNVITMASPGYEDISLAELGKGFILKEGKNTKEYLAEAAVSRPTILEQAKEAQAATSGTINLKNAPMLIKLATLMTREATAKAIAELDPATRWTDIVGSKDAVTDYTGHLASVRARNEKHPRSSTEHILGSETHSMGIHRPAMAEAIAATLAKSEHDHELMNRVSTAQERVAKASGVIRAGELHGKEGVRPDAADEIDETNVGK